MGEAEIVPAPGQFDGARGLYGDEFVAIVQVLASLPAPLVREADLEHVVAELVERLSAAYRHPRQRGLVGFRAIIDHYGMESRIGRSARLQVGLYQYEQRRRGDEARRGYAPAA